MHLPAAKNSIWENFQACLLRARSRERPQRPCSSPRLWCGMLWSDWHWCLPVALAPASVGRESIAAGAHQLLCGLPASLLPASRCCRIQVLLDAVCAQPLAHCKREDPLPKLFSVDLNYFDVNHKITWPVPPPTNVCLVLTS